MIINNFKFKKLLACAALLVSVCGFSKNDVEFGGICNYTYTTETVNEDGEKVTEYHFVTIWTETEKECRDNYLRDTFQIKNEIVNN